MADRDHDLKSWFERHVVQSLEDLKQNQMKITSRVEDIGKEMREEHAEHMHSDDIRFNELGHQIGRLKGQVASYMPVKAIVYGFVSSVLLAFIGYLIGSAMKNGTP